MHRLLITLGILSLCNSNAQAADLSNSHAQAVELFLLSNFDNVGDHNQVLGIAKQLQSTSENDLSTEDINAKTTPTSQIRDAVEKALTHGKVIVVGSGEGGIDGIKDLPSNPNLIVCLTSHMFLERYEDPKLLEKVNYIVLPTHDPKAQVLGSKLIEVTGVSHNRQAAISEGVYQKWQAEVPACKSYFGVILGGDAPTPQKQIQQFSVDDAKQLADYVITTHTDDCVLVLNGPRTGKYKTPQEEDKTVHRNGLSDPITAFFGKKLEEAGINTTTFDFQYDTPENKDFVSPYNAFDLVIGTLRANNGTLLVPGESTSVISEAIDTMAPGKVMVYENSAMNEVHKAHLQSELNSGRVSVLTNYKNIESPKTDTASSTPSATQVIAQKLWETIQK